MSRLHTPLAESPSDPGSPLPPAASPASAAAGGLPWYLEETYTWAYLSAFGTRFFDRQAVVNTILWGNAQKLMSWAISETEPGQKVWQPAAVYGPFSCQIAAHLGPDGRLDVSDVAPVQVELTRRKLSACTNARVLLHDASTAGTPAGISGGASGGNPPGYDVILCFFLLHEIPDPVKQQVVRRLLESVRPGGKVVFVDYHAPRRWHPLRLVMRGVFRWLEPFAHSLWHHEISSFAAAGNTFSWHKETRFGGLYQKVTARRPE